MGVLREEAYMTGMHRHLPVATNQNDSLSSRNQMFYCLSAGGDNVINEHASQVRSLTAPRDTSEVASLQVIPVRVCIHTRSRGTHALAKCHAYGHMPTQLPYA